MKTIYTYKARTARLRLARIGAAVAGVTLVALSLGACTPVMGGVGTGIQQGITEDSPHWDCHTMGNYQCGPAFQRYGHDWFSVREGWEVMVSHRDRLGRELRDVGTIKPGSVADRYAILFDELESAGGSRVNYSGIYGVEVLHDASEEG